MSMNAEITPMEQKLVRSFAMVSRATAAAALVGGLVVLLVWWMGMNLMITHLSGEATMKANTAFCFAIAGLSLLLLNLPSDPGGELVPWRRWAGWAGGVVVAAIGLASLNENFFHFSLGIDQVLARDTLTDATKSEPGRMSIASAAGFCFVGGSLVLLASRNAGLVFLSQILALASLIDGEIACLAYIYGERSLDQVSLYTTMSVLTSILLVGLSFGIIFARPRLALMAVLTSHHGGGQMARNILPLAIILPLVIGYFRLKGQEAGWYGTEFGLALFATTNILAFSILVWFSARLLNARSTELEQGARRYQFLADAMPEIIWTAKPNGIPDYFNKRWYDYTGLLPKQSMSEGWTQILHPDDVARSVASWKQSVQTGCDYEVEYRFRRASDGAYRWHLGRGFPMRNQAGDIIQWFGTCTDIDDQKQARTELEKQVAARTEELHALARRIGLATQAMQAGVWEWNVQTDALIWDVKMYELYGLPKDTPMNYARWSAMVLPEDLAKAEAALQKAITTRTQSSSEFQVRLPSGAIQYMHAAQGAVLDEKGEVARVIGVNIDVTERRESEEALKLSEKRFSSAFENATTGMALVSLEGRWMKVNQAVVDLLGYSAEELATKTFQDITHPEDLDADLEKLEKLVKGEIAFYKMEKRYFHKDGRIVWALLGVSLLRDQQNAPLYFISQVEDITEMKQALMRQQDLRRKAQAAERAKSEFLAIMSHEIRTPLNGVIGMTSILADTDLDEMQRDCLHTIQTSGESLLSVINDILDYSKIEAGRLQIESHSFTLEKCVEETLDLFAAQIREKHLEAVYLVALDIPPHLKGDALRLRQILVNLVGNAIKFTAKGEISLKVECVRRDTKDCSLIFSVTDTGIGIPKEGMEKLFQSFQQVDTSTTRRYGGSGLGLVISKRLAEFMGGEMWVKSEVGVGSTFFFTANFEIATDLRSDDPADTARVLRDRAVLIVDDNATNRQILEMQLKNWGMAPVVTASGAEALAQLGKQAFDVALLDYQMPEMDGVTLARTIRQRGRVPMILLSSSGETLTGADAELFRQQVPKPIRHSQLLKALLKVVGAESKPLAAEGKRFDGSLADGHPLTILLAEDNPTNQKVGMMMLSRLGYTADVAVNGLRAVEAAEKKAYDLILMDIQMPDMNGIEATKVIQERLGEKRPVIFALTAEALEGDEARFLAQGFDGYLSKPIQAAKLQAMLKTVKRRG